MATYERLWLPEPITRISLAFVDGALGAPRVENELTHQVLPVAARHRVRSPLHFTSSVLCVVESSIPRSAVSGYHERPMPVWEKVDHRSAWHGRQASLPRVRDVRRLVQKDG